MQQSDISKIQFLQVTFLSEGKLTLCLKQACFLNSQATSVKLNVLTNQHCLITTKTTRFTNIQLGANSKLATSTKHSNSLAKQNAATVKASTLCTSVADVIFCQVNLTMLTNVCKQQHLNLQQMQFFGLLQLYCCTKETNIPNLLKT